MLKAILLNKVIILIYIFFSNLLYLFDLYKLAIRKKVLFGDSVEKLAISNTTSFKYPENIILGNNVKIGPNTSIGALSKIIIEDNVRISQGVIIETAYLDLKSSIPYKHLSKEIWIKEGAWLASNVIILGGVTIGKNSVVSAGTIVKEDVPDNVIYSLESKNKIVKIIKR